MTLVLTGKNAIFSVKNNIDEHAQSIDSKIYSRIFCNGRGWVFTPKHFQALRRALLKYKLHTDQDLFERAYGYVRQVAFVDRLDALTVHGDGDYVRGADDQPGTVGSTRGGHALPSVATSQRILRTHTW